MSQPWIVDTGFLVALLNYEDIKELLWGMLAEIKTYRSTGPEVNLYLMGRHPSGIYLGLQTLVVQT